MESWHFIDKRALAMNIDRGRRRFVKKTYYIHRNWRFSIAALPLYVVRTHSTEAIVLAGL